MPPIRTILDATVDSVRPEAAFRKAGAPGRRRNR
jgi:hypothetical protein